MVKNERVLSLRVTVGAPNKTPRLTLRDTRSFFTAFFGALFVLLILGFGCSSKKEVGQKEEPQKVQVASSTLELKAEKQAPSKSAAETLSLIPLPLESGQVTQPPLETKPLPQSIPFQPTIIKGGLAVELIVDASGSMNGILGADTKFNIAKSLLEDLARQWSGLKEPAVNLAIRTFGSEYPLEANQCDDTKMILPVGAIDSIKVKESLNLIQAKGSSPIAYALRKAAEDLGQQNEDRVVILLTDGKDTCEQDPCTVSKELYEGVYKIITHVVGFDVAQEDEATLKCIADASRGVFLVARNKEELASALDEALRSTVPYNLRLKVLVGGSPLPTTITVYKSGTQEMVQREQSYGIELFRLKPGNYDILVEYANSIEASKPSKILKGVELTEQGKVEQEVRFDLASVTLSARDAKGEPAKTEYQFYKAGSQEKVAAFTSDGGEKTIFIAPGSYDLVANRVAEGQEMTLLEPAINLTIEQGFIKHFAFQTGTLVLKAQTSLKQPVGILYQVTKAGNPGAIVTKGQADSSGGKIELPPGDYDIYVEGQDPAAQLQAKGEIKNIKMEGGAILEKMATLIVGTLNLQAFKTEKDFAPTEFKIINPADNREVAKLTAKEGKASIALPPGKYDIQALLISTFYTKPPMKEAKGVAIEEGKTLDQTLRFELGTLKLLGRNSKEQRINSKLYIYEGGTENVVASAGPQEGWVQFDLAPGNYDVKVEDAQATVDPKPYVWQRDITIEVNSLYVREAVFTNAKLRLIGRGTNNEIVPVEFKVYEYGHDRPLLNGVTGQDWQSFDMPPGKYYIEASFHDLDTSQTLKKWVNLKVAENEFVEQELRF